MSDQKTAPVAGVSGTPPLVAEDARGTPAAGKRRRLAKAFDRPLDKLLREPDRVRLKVTLRQEDYVRLVELQQRLSDAGWRVKKSALLRAGLRLLATYDDDAFRQALGRISVPEA